MTVPFPSIICSRGEPKELASIRRRVPEDYFGIDAHHASSMMSRIAALREKYDLHMRVERFISNDAGVPGGDEKIPRK